MSTLNSYFIPLFSCMPARFILLIISLSVLSESNVIAASFSGASSVTVPGMKASALQFKSLF